MRAIFFQSVWPTYHEWVNDEARAKRFWPWVALAASNHTFERGEYERYVQDPKTEPQPAEVNELLGRIKHTARQLKDDLEWLRTLSYRIDDPKAPFRRGHLAWLHERISQSVAFGSLDEVIDTPLATLLASNAMRKLHANLKAVQLGAEKGFEKLNSEALSQPKTQRDKALINLVRVMGTIWENMTTHPVSAAPLALNKNDDRSHFVRFVGNVARLACGKQPTSSEIKTALKSFAKN